MARRRRIDPVAPHGKRTRAGAAAVNRNVAKLARTSLRNRMKHRALQRAELDLRIAEAWFPIDEEAWRGGGS